jgi:hypothetical protein
MVRLTAPTDANGRASVTAVANPVAGNYDVVASVGGVAVPASFHLTNTAGPPSQVVAMGGAIQSTEVGTAFADPLVVRVSDSGGNPVADVAVEFSAPASGAGATITPPSAITDANGEARVDATANTVAGSYAVAADVAGVATGAEFQLTNTAGPPAEIAISGGDDQSAVVNTPFASPLSVLVSDAFGNPVGNVDVEFAGPASGASASLSGNLTTGADGIAEVIATANSAVGSYVVTASVASIGGSGAEFHLTNVLGDGVVIGDISGDDQNAQIDTAFRCALAVQVTDSGLPQGGLTIEFEAPAAGASSILSDGVSTGTTVQAVTGLNGVALVEATANGIAGSYDVTATLLGSGQPPVVFHLTNLVDLLFANGFEGNCILVP